MNRERISIFWFRRDLRIEDNHGLSIALNNHFPVLPIFIFDKNITDELERNDPRITFIYKQLKKISSQLNHHSSSLYVLKGNPKEVWEKLLKEYEIHCAYTNEDYEPYAIQRDQEIKDLLFKHNIELKSFKDQVIFAKKEILKSDKTPYTVFTPYKNKWLSKFDQSFQLRQYSTDIDNFYKCQITMPNMADLGFIKSSINVIPYSLEQLKNYEIDRNFPAKNQTSYLSPHLRFGTISIRKIISQTAEIPVFLSELIWREFFMQILYHYPKVVHANFKRKYDSIEWRNNEGEFDKWKNGITGYPIVDAGMRELNATGYMHNRVRMITAGFLCKHLLIDWRWGEAYFAEKLLDYELASNNGNWQWVAGTGCDAAPYFRIFNPTEQVKKFDPDLMYVKKWVSELDSMNYPSPIVDHKMARERSIRAYKQGLTKYNKT